MFLIYLLFFVHISTIIDCKKSFTIVLDTTGSMKDDIEIIKAGLRLLMNDLVNRTDYEDYIIVPFNYPDVGTPSIANSPKALVENLSAIKAKDGVECPENSVAGIKKALEISEPGSSIYVFTDAYARDYGNINEITNLCTNKLIQVQIILSGVCLPSPSNRIPVGNIDVYYDIVGACSGAILRLDTAYNLRQAFPYITELNRIDWNDITTYSSFSGRKDITFKIDTFTTDFMVVVSGDRPQVLITNLQNQPPMQEKIIDTKYTQVLRLLKPDVGDYTIYIRCQGITSATLYRRHILPYEYGFSTREPRNLLETSPRPMPGKVNYILICSLDTTFRPRTLEFTDGKIKTDLKLEETVKSGTYITKAYVESEKNYRISITGYNTFNNKEMFATTKSLIPQKLDPRATWIKPNSQIIKEEIDVVEYGGNLTIACKVYGYPKPKIQWKDDSGTAFTSEEILLEIPSIYISYLTIENLTVSLKIQCKCENSIGEAMDSTEVVVKRSFFFEVTQTPENISIEYGNDGTLYCAVNSYPESVIKWYHNDTELETSDNILFKPEDNSLIINNMRIEDVGVYTCEIKNSEKTESYKAVVSITGLEIPLVEVMEKEVVKKPDEECELECRIVKGKPLPNVAWSYKSETDYYFGDLPEGAVVENGKLIISFVHTEHKGIYRCEATNIMGQHTAEVNLKVQFPPVIEKDEISNLTVRDGESVELTCKVRASPRATVRWEMSQDDVICNLDERHTTDHLNTHHFIASWNDSGNYHCIAENSVGRDEKTINLNVLVPPYIEQTKANTFSVAVGDTVQLPCNVLFGNPAPSLNWKFIAPDTESSFLKRDSSTNMLSINKATKSNEGCYICIVENEIGSDTIKYYVKVQ